MSRNLFEDALKAEGVTGELADLARSIYAQESGGGRNTKTSNRGAVGGMQVLPGTFLEVADPGWDIHDPLANARAGIRYIKKMNQKAEGDLQLTAVGYYGGPGGISKARRGIAVSDPKNPHAPNTLQYAQQVVARVAPGQRSTPVADAAPAPMQAAGAPEATVAAAPVQQGPVGLPDFLVRYLTDRSVRLGGQTEEQANAWTKFLSAMGRQQAPVRQAVAEPEEFMPELPRMTAPAMRNQAVDFRPFDAFNTLGQRTRGVPR